MKTFSKLNESARTTDTQPGNDLAKTGLTNHYTPIENILINVIFIIVEIIFILFTFISSSLGAYLIRKGKTKKGLILVLSNIFLLTITFIRSLLKKDFFFKGGMFAFLIYNRQELYSTLILLLYACLFIYTIYSFNTLKIKLKENNNMSK